MWRKRTNTRALRNVTVGIFLVLLVLCTLLQFYENRRSAMETCSIMLDQVAELITQNDENLYTIQENLKEDYLIRAQVGLAPERLLRLLDTSSIRVLVRTLPVIDGMAIYVVDENTGRVTASTKTDMVGYQVLDSDRTGQPLDRDQQHFEATKIIRGEKTYIVYERVNNRDLLVSYTVKAANADLGFSVLYLALFMTAAYFLLQHTIDRYISYLEKQSAELSDALDARLLSRTDETVTYRFLFRDNGIGMSPEFQEHMYETFAREKNDARTTYQGSGLGLSIVKKLVDAMGGTLTCQSEKGVGTTFTLDMTFPIAPVPDRAAAPSRWPCARSSAPMTAIF